jgi:(p)ppGpp synthase/HD superfamily hydrolase
MATLERAIEIAVKAHKDQKDKSGQPYILHPLRVMQKGTTDVEKICGVLHDLIEDTSWTFEDLQKEGFAPEVIEVLRLVTKEQDEDYSSFTERISTNPVAVKVKLNDLADNLDVTRLDYITPKDLNRLNKYLTAWKLLTKIREQSNTGNSF